MPKQPRLLVLSQLFPSELQPTAGLFVRERMFRVAKHVPIVVVAPQPWFPLQGLIRRFRPHFRPPAPRFEIMQGVEVHRPRFLCFPGVLKWTDGFFLALCILPTVRRLVRKHGLNLLDVHFGYPDGYAGGLLGRWLRLPVVITLRGKEQRQAGTGVGTRLRQAIMRADRLVCVSEALQEVAVKLGAEKARTRVIGNGVDLSKFGPMGRDEARRALGLPLDAQIIVSVGTLVERKGFHRVIDCLPVLCRRHPNLFYLIVGGAGPEGDIASRLHRQVEALGMHQRVRFLGPCPPEKLKIPLSAADLFVLATSYEGWANVFLEAMACGLPVVTTRVGGNAQVVDSPDLGVLVDHGDPRALAEAIGAALVRQWDRKHIIEHAGSNAWESRIDPLLEVFHEVLHADMPSARRQPGAVSGLKILYHHRTASRDGQAVHIAEMIEALRQAGCEVIVVEPPGTANARFGADAKAASALRRTLPKLAVELLELAYNWIAYRRLKRAYLRHRPDVLYERHNLYLLAGKWLKRRFKLPYLLEVNSPLALERMRHGGLALPWLARRLELGVWNAADVVLPVTGVLADILVDHGVTRERIRVVPNGINPRAFDAAPPPAEAKRRLGYEGRLVLGFTGFVRPWHGLNRVLDFIAATRRPELILLVVGDGPARAELLELAARLGIAKQVHFTGVVERDRVPSFVAAFDIAVQPAATAYASPLKLFEYMASGCPIIAPRQPNVAEVLTDEVNALLFAPDEPQALAKALERLVADPVLRERLGSAARATVKQRGFTWLCNAERVVAEAQRLASAPALAGHFTVPQDVEAS